MLRLSACHQQQPLVHLQPRHAALVALVVVLQSADVATNTPLFWRCVWCGAVWRCV